MSAKPSVLEVIAVFLVSVTAALYLEPLVHTHRLGSISQTPGDFLAFYLAPYLAASDALTIIVLRIVLSYAIDLTLCFTILFGLLVMVHHFRLSRAQSLANASAQTSEADPILVGAPSTINSVAAPPSARCSRNSTIECKRSRQCGHSVTTTASSNSPTQLPINMR